ncbi:hypothetical protein [Leptospira levettii]|uniref:Uncharacterized protein n=1 Tax=Leptospira levettii TaxID=2023178 RepID=A0AAW5VEP7_9LEPT|nr:hypothetical protein [Leptospira levettii]MCW7466111.1 hypothetical protein [Leptospira levettii]MCW7512364.1 hypothetical protein [Leptospira levettii]MCW7516372.1 hypothetical protein [Leptospira levettii]
MKYRGFFVFGFFFFVSPSLPQWFTKPATFESIWSKFQLAPNLDSEAYTISSFPILREVETKENEEYDYYFQLCKFQEIRELTEILSYLSFYDALLQIKRCTEITKNETANLEKQIKKKLFDLIVFPKLEILSSEISNAENLSLVRELQSEWEKTVYLYSNFYKPHEVLLFGKEREYTLSLNRILYSDMPESKRRSFLLRLLQDIKTNQRSTYQMFYYSKQNPWNLAELKSENEKSKSYFLQILSSWKIDPLFTDGQKQQLNELQICLEKLPTEEKKIRIFGFFGFFSDYGRFSVENPSFKTRENLTKLLYIRQTLFQSHHFQKRLENVMINCKNSVESKKEL